MPESGPPSMTSSLVFRQSSTQCAHASGFHDSASRIFCGQTPRSYLGTMTEGVNWAHAPQKNSTTAFVALFPVETSRSNSSMQWHKMVSEDRAVTQFPGAGLPRLASAGTVWMSSEMRSGNRSRWKARCRKHLPKIPRPGCPVFSRLKQRASLAGSVAEFRFRG